MRRIVALTIAAVTTAVAGCSKKQAADTSAGLCTVRPSDATLAWPQLTGKPPPAPPAGSWRWINVWATFCKPCVRELPRLVAWQEKLAASGIAVDTVFVNADPDPADVAAFAKDYPNMPPPARSVAMADADTAMPRWFRALGLTGSTTIPLQIWVAPTGKIACVREGSVEDADYARVEAFLKNSG